MTDTAAVLMVVIPSVITTAGVIIVALINKKESKKVVETVKDVGVKVETYHKEVNGKMKKLLKTAEALGNEKGKAEQKEKTG